VLVSFPTHIFFIIIIIITHYPSPQVPYEILNKKFRSGQKVIDREANHVANCLAEVDRLFTGQEEAEEKAAMLRQLDSLKQQLQQLKVGRTAGQPQATAAPAQGREDSWTASSSSCTNLR
jgi:hypothetical protein